MQNSWKIIFWLMMGLSLFLGNASCADDSTDLSSGTTSTSGSSGPETPTDPGTVPTTTETPTTDVKSNSGESTDGTNSSGGLSTSVAAEASSSTGTEDSTQGDTDSDSSGSESGVEPEFPCGDGIVQGTEECDDGDNDNTDICPDTCQKASCGDGFVLENQEQCDDGNMSNLDGCTNNCQLAICGDGFMQPGEGCDDLRQVEPRTCQDDCTLVSCGNLKLDEGESCDDGNKDNTDNCPNTCQLAICGDTFTQAGMEDCDDGNLNSEDGCDETCHWEEKVVFLTSSYHDGDLGGLDGAKKICEMLATEAGLITDSQTFWPFLSTDTFWPKKDFVKWQGLYVNTIGDTVAEGWDNFLINHLNPILYDEHGNEIFLLPPAYYRVWTGTDEEGEPYFGHCKGWTFNQSPNTDYATVGRVDKLNSEWTNSAQYACIETFRLYCVEQ